MRKLQRKHKGKAKVFVAKCKGKYNGKAKATDKNTKEIQRKSNCFLAKWKGKYKGQAKVFREITKGNTKEKVGLFSKIQKEIARER